MTDRKNIADDKRGKRQKKHDRQEGAAPLGVKPREQRHQHPLPTGHGPDADDAIDQTEQPQDPLDQPL